MTSPCLKLAISLGIRGGVPFVEGAERVVRLGAATGFGDDHTLVVDFVNQLIAWLQAQGRADRLGNRGLRLGRKLAGDHVGLCSKFEGCAPRTDGKEFPCAGQVLCWRRSRSAGKPRQLWLSRRWLLWWQIAPPSRLRYRGCDQPLHRIAMTTLELTLNLPDQLARDAKAAGLLTEKELERLEL